MTSIDMPLEELQKYKPRLTRQADFSRFWKRALAEAGRRPVEAEFRPRKMPLRGFDFYDVRYRGGDGSLLTGELVIPRGAKRLAGLVMYHGYGEACEPAFQQLHWAAAGVAVLSVNTRGQRGETDDAATYPGPHVPGHLTAGIADPETYYYRHVYIDSVRAIDALLARPEVDPACVAVNGISQGGGQSLAAAALDARVRLCFCESPFLCDFPRSVAVAGEGDYGYGEISTYLEHVPLGGDAAAFRTLSYFDTVNLAPWIKARTFISTGLGDHYCLPSTAYAVCNHLRARKTIRPFPYMGHESNPHFILEAMEVMRKEFRL